MNLKTIIWTTLYVILGLSMACGQTSPTLPAGAQMSVRLQSPLSTKTAKKGDSFKTRVIKPVHVNGKLIIPSNAIISGVVTQVKPPTAQKDEAELGLAFNKLFILDEYDIDARLKQVDNARESVSEIGVIVGVRVVDTLAGKIEDGIEKLSEKNRELADLIRTGMDKHGPKASGEIEFPAGMEFVIQLNKPLSLPVSRVAQSPPSEIVSTLNAIRPVLSKLPPTVTTEKGDRPADLINLLFLGSRELINQAFAAAGWVEADKRDRNSILKATRAVIEDSVYSRAPVSTLYLFGRPEDLAFQKQGNTFAKRHHLRLWKVPGSEIGGNELWAAAATHDIGYEVVETKEVFSHKIDPEVDKEREKIKDDLLAAGAIRAFQFADRDNPVTSGRTATGGVYKSDGKILILELQRINEQ